MYIANKTQNIHKVKESRHLEFLIQKIFINDKKAPILSKAYVVIDVLIIDKDNIHLFIANTYIKTDTYDTIFANKNVLIIKLLCLK